MIWIMRISSMEIYEIGHVGNVGMNGLRTFRKISQKAKVNRC